jgi:hypothetical protein
LYQKNPLFANENPLLFRVRDFRSG